MAGHPGWRKLQSAGGVTQLHAARDIMPSLPGIRRLACLLLGLLAGPSQAHELKPDGYHVHPGDNLQEIADLAAANPTNKNLFLHPGTYRPQSPRQALLALNRAHDGIHLSGIGRPTLTAANPELAIPGSPSTPAIVNHILYLGDGLSTNTVIEHLQLTGANHFVTQNGTDRIEPDRTFRKGRFYFGDGGAVKIYHRSYPTLRDLEITDNYASPCAGGISIQHEGATNQFVLIQNCIFRNNRAEVTGAALDLLWGSQARVVNCLFTGNISNTGPGEGENPFDNNGVITVFPRSRLVLDHCTLTGNRNGIDDQGGLSEFSHCIFVRNQRPGGTTLKPRYELDLQKGARVIQCIIAGPCLDPTRATEQPGNHTNPPDFVLGPNLLPPDGPFSNYGYQGNR